MAPKIFLTGATGYIGGDSLYLIAQKHPDWEVTALVRSEAKAAQVKSQYPGIRTVVGDLDSAALIEEEVRNADIVYHFANCDHVASAKAIAKGASHHTPERPLWWIHTSGTGILTLEDQRAKTHGIERPKSYDDWDHIDEVTNLPDDAFHRDVDKIVLEAGYSAPASVKTAIVCPCTIYGPGRGPGNPKSYQAYKLSEAVLQRKKGLLVGEGKNVWHEIHVHDLSDLYITLGEAAAEGGGKATWNDKGYYFAENGQFCWGDVERAIARIAYEKKLIPSPDVEPLSDDQVAAINPFGLYSWGTNSRGHAIRARNLFGWSPSRPSLSALLPSIVEIEAKDLGLL
ncbi:hypothetical protein ASPZODRAFT_157417 [Penicilliopsis zonata CBS 506.65]|uniref:NAD(P)-binding domain-containing protein n=1 Tax=Penicilliopsis zonata CBS 506.65 TaxID=1073090 RepID=A0A1L9SNT0_9EURO|nr:hypothetical protein ASPZODRAFT_157417 [Penicilliopsis zonata CBS 506.65]OJJ48912.1 hypothetical protein ASPZODRAFT_157417 [Penicilliopsis zonata CBS 506.65]